MRPPLLPCQFALSLAVSLCAGQPTEFTKQTLTTNYFSDGIASGDFNKDGLADVVAGPLCYFGPAFTNTVEIYPPKKLDPAASPSESMYNFPWDFNADGWLDLLVLGRVHLHSAYWYENPQGRPGHWKKHFVFERILGESPAFEDVNQDGRPDLVSHWQGAWGLVQSDRENPTAPWKFTPLTSVKTIEQFYHGTGVGDLNNDGRPDILLNEGWLEQPSLPTESWTEHPFRFAKKGGAQMFAWDIDGDGDRDVLTALDAHGWGIAWFEQIQTNDQTSFRQHDLIGDRSVEKKFGAAFTQPHAMIIGDINRDGALDFFTGKRRWAHGPKGDIEPNADPVLYWFEARPGKSPAFIPHLVDAASGLGVQVGIADLNADQKPDLLSASKLGAFVFLQK